MDLARHLSALPSFFRSYYTGEVYNDFAVVLELSYRCNARCGYCDRWKDRSNDCLTLLDIQKIIAGLKQHKCRFCLTLTGGEPFLRKDIIEIIEYISNAGVPVVINTNGVLLERYIEDIIRFSNGIRSFNISLDSHLPEIHNQIRGMKNGFQIIMKNIERLKHKVNILLQCTITHSTLYQIQDFINLSKRLGVQGRVQLAHEDPQNQFVFNKEGMKIPLEEYGKMKEYIALLLNSNKGAITFMDEIFFKLFPYLIMDRDILKTLKCLAAGRTIYHIDPKGNVFPCETRRDQLLGNIREDSFYGIVKSGKSREWRKQCKNGKNACSCLYGCVAFKNIYYQFFPLMGIPQNGFFVKNKWEKTFKNLETLALSGKK